MSHLVEEDLEICNCISDETVKQEKNNLLKDEIIYDIADFYKVFGDSTRIKILYALLNKEICVGGLVEILDMSQSAISHQLRVLRQNNIVKYRKEGKTVYYSIDDDHVKTVLQQSLYHIMHKK